jgi:hypothetical protein
VFTLGIGRSGVEPRLRRGSHLIAVQLSKWSRDRRYNETNARFTAADELVEIPLWREPTFRTLRIKEMIDTSVSSTKRLIALVWGVSNSPCWRSAHSFFKRSESVSTA